MRILTLDGAVCELLPEIFADAGEAEAHLRDRDLGPSLILGDDLVELRCKSPLASATKRLRTEAARLRREGASAAIVETDEAPAEAEAAVCEVPGCGEPPAALRSTTRPPFRGFCRRHRAHATQRMSTRSITAKAAAKEVLATADEAPEKAPRVVRPGTPKLPRKPRTRASAPTPPAPLDLDGVREALALVRRIGGAEKLRELVALIEEV